MFEAAVAPSFPPASPVMGPSPPTIIIFGPTGQTACFAARTAHSHGAKIVLAMRDPSKPISGLPTTEEQRGNYTRVQADLTDPASVATAVKSSGATRAFIYFVFGTKDYMRASIEALRDNGVDFVVFLSSSSVGLHTGERDDVAALRGTAGCDHSVPAWDG
jgi:NAD(P)-dependent dehydrogenase (short-subunit alcohol dehydrogenase family)